MAYIYPLMWFAVGLIMIFKLHKENKIFIFAGIYFLFLGGWWLMSILHPEYNLFRGQMGLLMRGISAFALIIVGVAFFREKKKNDVLLKQEPQTGEEELLLEDTDGTTPISDLAQESLPGPASAQEDDNQDEQSDYEEAQH
ncbi:hypothetical protein [Clostridium minihomine]|uniref:hypothetical protein n=1 Tax=Clostridium minihomine TaxID=2045012 RepID=UPI000C78C2E7|nr:hypothetical protein [Clostridium minihomine]